MRNTDRGIRPRRALAWGSAVLTAALVVAVLVLAFKMHPPGLPADAPRESPAVAVTPPTVRFGRCGGWTWSDCVVDGDTFILGEERIRIADIDAPELHSPRCVDEAELGEKAAARLQALLNAGPFDLTARGSRDEDIYGRKLRVVERDGASLGDALVAEGLARPWGGRRRPWCEGG